MSALPESFDVAKRFGLFIYIARNADHPISLYDLFSKYKLDLESIKKELGSYHSDCSNKFARKRLTAGLVSLGGMTSFSKYARMGHWLGFFDFDLKAGIIAPNWITLIVAELAQRFGYKTIEFELPNTLKLLSTYLLIEKDRDLIVPLVTTLKKIQPLCQMVDTKILQLEYARNLQSTFLQILTEITTTSGYAASVKRVNFFRKNVELLEAGQPSTRGLKHMIEPRINWLLDLALVDCQLLCDSGHIKPINIWNEVGPVASSGCKNDAFFSKYAQYIGDLSPEKTESPFKRMSQSEILALSVKILQKETQQLLLVESVLVLAWLLLNSRQTSYVSFNDILSSIEDTFVIYRRKMEGLGFIQP